MQFRDNSNNETQYDFRKYIPFVPEDVQEPYSWNGFYPLYKSEQNAKDAGAKNVLVVKMDNVNHYLYVKEGVYEGTNEDITELEGYISYQNSKWRPSDDVVIKTPISSSNTTVGANLNINLKTDRGGNLNKAVIPANFAGKGHGVSFPDTVDVYSRHDLIIYIGDDYAFSTADITGGDFDSYHDLFNNTSFNKVITNQSNGLTNAGYADYSDINITGFNGKTNPIHRMLYKLNSLKRRGTSVISILDQNLTFDFVFSKTKVGYDYIINNINSELNELMNNYIQARLAMIIINLGRKEDRDNYVNHIGQFISDIRTDLNLPELPVLLTKYDFIQQTIAPINTEHEGLILDYDVMVAETMQNKNPNDSSLSTSEIITLGDEYANIVKNTLEPPIDLSRLGTAFWFKADDEFVQLAINDNKLYDRVSYYNGDEYKKALSVSRTNEKITAVGDVTPQTLSVNGRGIVLKKTMLNIDTLDFFNQDSHVIDYGAMIIVATVDVAVSSYFHIAKGSASIDRDGVTHTNTETRFLSHVVWDNSEVYFDAGPTTLSPHRVSGAGLIKEPMIIAYTFDKTYGNILRINGKEVDRADGMQRSLVLAPDMYINGNGNISTEQKGSTDIALAELMTFNKRLLPGKVMAIEGMLAKQWNLELPQDHPYK